MDRNRQIANSPDRDRLVIDQAGENATSASRQIVELICSRFGLAGPTELADAYYMARLHHGIIQECTTIGIDPRESSYIATLTTAAVERVIDGTADRTVVRWVKIQGRWTMSLVTMYE